MTRRKKRVGDDRANWIYVNLSSDPELAQAVEQWMVSYGLDSRQQAVLTMIRTAISAVPVDSAIAGIIFAAVKQMRDHENEALRQFHLERAALFGAR